MTTTRLIRPSDLAAIVTDVGLDSLLDELIERLVDALREHDPEVVATIDRSGFHYGKPDLGLVEWMPAMDHGRRVSVKTVGYHPSNPVERGVPTILASTSLYDTVDGRLIALCEATFLTSLRTGAASAIATDILAVDAGVTLGVIGCGAQAVTQIHAISRVRPIERVLAYDANPDVARTLGARVPIDGLDIVPVDATRIEELASICDVLCTVTSVSPSDGPVLPDVDGRPSLHVNAVGADFPSKRELPDAMLRRALVCPDVTSQCLQEGECQGLEPHELGPDLVALVRERGRWEGHRNELTVFDSTGWALEDLVAAELVLDHAQRLGCGIEIDLHPVPKDPYDPYEGLR